MATRSLNVQITGDARSLNNVLDRTESRTKRWGTGMAKGFAVAGAAAAGGLAVGLKKSAEAAIEAEKSQARMVTQLRASGVSYKAHAKQIDEVIQKHSKLSGLDDEDLQDAFTNIVRVTGDVDKSLRLTGLAADFARAKHIDVAKAGELVGKVAGGNTGILSRYGIQIDKGATSSEALAKLQQKFSGQAEAYGKTTAGALDRAGVAGENLGEIVGSKLTPLLAKGATWLVNLVDKAGKLAGPIRTATGSIADFARRIQRAFSGGNDEATHFASNVRKIVVRVVGFIRDLGRSIGRIFAGSGDDFRTIGRAFLKIERIASDVVLAITKRALPILKAAIEGIAIVVRGMVKIVAGLLSGDFSKAWDGVKDIVRGVLHALGGIIKGAWNALGDAMGALARFLIRKMKSGLGGLGKALKDKIVDESKKGIGGAMDFLSGAIPGFKLAKPIADLVGDGVGRVKFGSVPGGGTGLDGADQDLGPFARIGAGMGLHVSSGLRPGAITSSGNPSYHGTGDAIDMSGPAGAMMRFFRTMKKTFGSRLRELIYTPGGVGIKDGRPFTYTGQVAADHYDHVHLAYTGPFGDGLGRRPGTGDGYGDMRNLWVRGGGRAAAANMAAAIAMAESGGRRHPPDNRNSDGSIDRGPWQINSVHGRLSTHDPLGNARAAVRISSNGRNWRPWTTFNTGAYRQFLRRGSTGGGGGSARPRGGGSDAANSFGASMGGLINPGSVFNPGAGQSLISTTFPLKGRGGFVSEDSGDTGDTGDPNQPLIDAINAAAEQAAQLAEEQKRRDEQRIAVELEVAANQKLILKLSDQGPQIVAAVVAAVSGGIGGKVGLGLQTPSFAGGVARY